MSMAASDSSPLVSVVIPTYNRTAYLRLALKSAVEQSYRNLEIIICDNASPEDPSAVVAEFNDPRIRLHRNERNLGPTPNTLLGVSMAHGEYVAILGDDDVWQPEFITTLLAPLEQDPKVIVSFCNHDIIDAQGVRSAEATDRVTRCFGRHLLHAGTYREFDDIALVYRAICVVSGSIIRRRAIDWSRIPEDMPISVDLYIDYLLATAGGAAAFVPSYLMQYRYHSLQSAGSMTNFHRSWRADLRWTLDLWLTFLGDERLHCRTYIKMTCARKAVAILLYRLKQRELGGIGADIAKFFRSGLLDPRNAYYFLHYFLRFRRQRLGRLVP
jgi:glycosyltransferase involved in cell wall biosynthesis